VNLFDACLVAFMPGMAVGVIAQAVLR